MKKSIYQSYDDLPLFLNAELVAKVLGVAPPSAYELMHEVEQTPEETAKPPVNAPCAPTEPHPEPTPRKIRKSGTGCLYQINDNLWEGSFFPRLPGGKRKKFNVYAETREQCEIKLAEMIERVKAEIAEEKKRLKAE